MDPYDSFTRTSQGCYWDIMTTFVITSLFIHIGPDCSSCLTGFMWEWRIFNAYMRNYRDEIMDSCVVFCFVHDCQLKLIWYDMEHTDTNFTLSSLTLEF